MVKIYNCFFFKIVCRSHLMQSVPCEREIDVKILDRQEVRSAKEFQAIWKSHPGISTQKCGAQKVGRISDHLEITSTFISAHINSEMLCTLFMNLVMKNGAQC